MKAIPFRKLIEKDGILEACRQVDQTVTTEQQAELYVFRYVMRLLAARNLIAAAVVLWGTNVFNPGPKAVQDIMRCCDDHSKLLVQGCGSVGKSYTLIVWLLLDWLADPEFTNIKIISATKGHAKGNVFSTLVRLHRGACIPLPGIISGDYIGLDDKEKKSGIAILAVPPGDDGKGRLQGFHPDPRPQPNPSFGLSSRVRVFMDECEEIPVGVWEGVDNALLSMDETGTIKIFGAYNPKDVTSKAAQNAEPQGGWDSFDIESGVSGSNEWVSRNGWNVLRIDGRKTENVAWRRTAYAGFLTWKGYQELEDKDGGNSINFYTFARGAYPPQGAVGTIITSWHLKQCRGEFSFIGKTVECGSVDTALEGGDNCVLTKGRTGLAAGFTPLGGEYAPFKETRRVVQAEQQFVLKKGDTKAIGDQIIATCKALNIGAEYTCIDATGNGAGVWGYLRSVWSPDVQGVDFSKEATEIRILEQDTATPNDRFEGIHSEVWYVLKEWMEFGFFAISPGMRREPLEAELMGRRGVFGAGKKMRVEKKRDYKKRISGTSPDYADSLTLLPQCVRQRESLMGTMVDKPKERRFQTRPTHSTHDRVAWFQDSGV